MSTSTDHLQHYSELIQVLYQHCSTELPFCSDQAEQVDLEFLEALKQLSEADKLTDDHIFKGQSLICRIITHYPHITHAVNRDLLWYFGGDCLHYMSDEEIGLYQQVDELLYQAQNLGQPMEVNAAKARVFKLH